MGSRPKMAESQAKVRRLPLPHPAPAAQAALFLDIANERVHRGNETLALPPKAFAVLRYLHEHPGRLVTKQELLDVVWPGIAVTEAVLKNCILKLREVLGDPAKTPQFIETVHRRGYRLLASLATSAPPVQGSTFNVQGPKTAPVPSPQHPAPNLVGRDAELAQLHGWLDKALNGERQLGFVTGEPGIGKTSLVTAFMARLAAEHGLRISQGQCIDHYGAGEAYLPVLTALGQLCREPGGEQLVLLLNQYAPAWLVQMPGVLTEEELATLQRKTAGVTKERMLREMAEALEVLTRERPLVFVFEDLHWSDPSTLDLLAFFARRSQPARVLIIGTYRPSEMLAAEHPLRGIVHELQLHKQCEELQLEPLSIVDIAAYLAQRITMGAQPRAPLQDLASVIRQRTEGNPLFMVNIVDELMAQGELDGAAVAGSTPVTIRQMIERHLERLSPEHQRILETASVAGVEFSIAAVAAGIEGSVEEVEQRCATLVRQAQFLQVAGTGAWPDGTVAARYSFLHALYQNVLYEQVPTARRQRLHRQIGAREEQGYGEHAREIAAELAYHYGCSGNTEKAVDFLQLAGEQAMQRSANVEAVTHFRAALALLKTLPATAARTQQELTLHIALGPALIAIKGWAAPEVGAVYTQAQELCRQVEESAQLSPVLWGLWVHHLLRADLKGSRGLGEQLLDLAQKEHDPALLLEAHLALGTSLLWFGEFLPARSHFEQAMALYDPQQHRSHTSLYGQEPGMITLSTLAYALWMLGYPNQALDISHATLTLSQEVSHPYSQAFAFVFIAGIYRLRREDHRTQELAEAAMAISREQGFPWWLAWGTILRGRTRSEQGQEEEGIAEIRQGLGVAQTIRTEWGQPYFLALLAEAYGKVGQREKGLPLLTKALTVLNASEEHWCEAELYRLKGELTLQSRQSEDKSKISQSNAEVEKEVEEYFHKAIAIARTQQAKSWELRAVMSLSRLWRKQGKKKEARQMLAEIYGWFTEGFDTKDLQEAKALLDMLSV